MAKVHIEPQFTHIACQDDVDNVLATIYYLFGQALAERCGQTADLLVFSMSCKLTYALHTHILSMNITKCRWGIAL